MKGAGKGIVAYLDAVVLRVGGLENGVYST